MLCKDLVGPGNEENMQKKWNYIPRFLSSNGQSSRAADRHYNATGAKVGAKNYQVDIILQTEVLAY